MTRPIVHRLLMHLAQGLRVVFLAVQEALENHKHLFLRGRYLQLVTTTLALGRLENKSWHSPVWSSAEPLAGCCLGVGVRTPGHAAAMWIQALC